MKVLRAFSPVVRGHSFKEECSLRGKGVWPNAVTMNNIDVTHEDSFIFSLYFHKGKAQNNESKEHCLCIKENQNKSSRSFLRNPSTLKSPLAHLCLKACFHQPYWLGHVILRVCFVAAPIWRSEVVNHTSLDYQRFTLVFTIRFFCQLLFRQGIREISSKSSSI